MQHFVHKIRFGAKHSFYKVWFSNNFVTIIFHQYHLASNILTTKFLTKFFRSKLLKRFFWTIFFSFLFTLQMFWTNTEKFWIKIFCAENIFEFLFFSPKYFSSQFLLDNNTFFYQHFFCPISLQINTYFWAKKLYLSWSQNKSLPSRTL